MTIFATERIKRQRLEGVCEYCYRRRERRPWARGFAASPVWRRYQETAVKLDVCLSTIVLGANLGVISSTIQRLTTRSPVECSGGGDHLVTRCRKAERMKLLFIHLYYFLIKESYDGDTSCHVCVMYVLHRASRMELFFLTSVKT